MNSKYILVLNILKKYNQEHLLNFYNELSFKEKENILNQILNIDFELLKNIYLSKDIIENRNINIEPIEYISKEKLSLNEIDNYCNIGKEAILSGNYGICILAGGQGTRLGHNGPKGSYILNLPKPKPIFKLLIDNLITAYAQYGIYIPLYIMTSNENNDETINFFEKKDYFKYPKNMITFFKQGELPLVNTNEKLILENKGKIKEASDGNGGIFEALFKNNILSKLKQNGIKYLFVGNIDNILLKIVDTLQIGIMIKNNSDIISNSILKIDPNEKVGLFCKKNGKYGVVEYIDISPELMNLRNSSGNLIFSQAYYGSNIFTLPFLEKVATEKLPYHLALKKSNYINMNGEMVKIDEPNVYKFETFIFDVFEKANKLTILNVKRQEEFAPIKNADGIDSPKTAIELYNNYYKN